MKKPSIPFILFALGSKFLRLCIAWSIGSVIYFIYAIALTYDGFPSMICQPFMAMGVSAVITFIALILGLPLMIITPHRPLWLALTLAGICLLTGFLFLFIPEPFTPLFRWIPIDIQGEMDSLEFVLVYIGYCIVIFTIVNWPRMFILNRGKASPSNASISLKPLDIVTESEALDESKESK